MTVLTASLRRTSVLLTQQQWRLNQGSAISELCQRSFLPFSYPGISALVQQAASLAISAPHSPAALPRLPVPRIEDTLSKYLRSVKPLVSLDAFRNAEALVQDFLRPHGVGQQLQEILLQRANSCDNWLAEWWLNTAYLECRSPVVVWSSPGLVMPLQQWDTQLQQLKYAARLVSGALDFKILLNSGQLPQEYAGVDALDMSQYDDVLGTCRVPGVRSDQLLYHRHSRHMAVAHNGHFFSVDVLDENGGRLGETQIYEQLCRLVEMSPRRATHQLGLLTTENRNVWARAYNTLRSDSENCASLDAIHSALFLVCLDGGTCDTLAAPPSGQSMNRQTRAALQCVHGNGARANAGNRWYDKCIQLVVGAEGHVGITYEHSPAEGVPVARMMDYLVQGRRDSTLATSGGQIVAPPRRLDFKVDETVAEAIDRAADNLQMMVEDLDMSCFTYTGYGKKFIKSQKMSPDSYIQMAIQLAYFRIHGEPGSTYESAATRKFSGGRTETIRSCCEESVLFCKTMLDPGQSAGNRADALSKAINAHKDYAKQAVNGCGCDRHMLGLKLAAIERGMDVPALFMDECWAKSTHMKLSTSQVPVVADAFMCYGPLVPDGYGCCYNPRETSINFGTSACNSSPATVAAEFRAALELSLNDMFSMMQSARRH